MAAATAPIPAAVRRYRAAVDSLVDAENLLRLLEVGDQTNGYVADATRRALDLVSEMEADLQDVMDTWTPEQVGL